jgi:PAS domain S-box-containing protein
MERPCLADLLLDEKIDRIPEFYQGKYNMAKYMDEGYEATDFFPILGKEGKWLFFSAAPIRDSQGKIIGALETLEDITERKKAEEALQKEFVRLQTMVSNAPVVIFAVDKHGIFTLSEGRALSIMGLKGGEVVGRSVFDVYRDKPDDQEHFRRALKGEAFTTFVRVGDRFFESYHEPVFTPDGKFDGSSGILVDITERKKAEEKLKQSQLFNEAILNSIPGLLYLYDDTGHLIHWNKQHEYLTGYSGEEIRGRYIMDWFGNVEPDTSSIKKGIDDVMAKGYGTAEARLITKDGKSIPMYFTGVKLNISGRDHLLGIGTDITERKKAEKELEKYREHLEELVHERTIKLEASNKELEAFSYSASHDLRAPLRSIEGFSQALLEDYRDKLDIQGKDYLTRIKTATRRMADLIEDMMQLSRITRMEMNIEKVNLTLIARSVMSELQKSQPQRHVEISIADSLEDTADLRLMRIVLDNLLSNAWKFTERQAKAKIEFGLWKTEGRVKTYFIRDNGAGFDMAYSDKLFAPFQRLHADDEFPGTGIGLATVRRIINRHGGKVWAEGEIDKGASFYFSINEK